MKYKKDEMLRSLNQYSDWIFDLDNTLYSQEEYDLVAFHNLEVYLLKSGACAQGVADVLFREKRTKGPFDNNLFNRVFDQYGLRDYTGIAIDYYRAADFEFYSSSKMAEEIVRCSGSNRLFLVTNGHVKIQNKKIRAIRGLSMFDGILICPHGEKNKLKPSRWGFDELDKKFSLRKPVYVGDSNKIDGGFALNSGIEYINYEFKDEDWR